MSPSRTPRPSSEELLELLAAGGPHSLDKVKRQHHGYRPRTGTVTVADAEAGQSHERLQLLPPDVRDEVADLVDDLDATADARFPPLWITGQPPKGLQLERPPRGRAG